jgi:hypothetical protein
MAESLLALTICRDNERNKNASEEEKKHEEEKKNVFFFCFLTKQKN